MNKRGIVLAVILVLVLPQILFSAMVALDRMQNDAGEEGRLGSAETTGPEPCSMIQVKDGDDVYLMELDEYITGVVLGEMPAHFELEALKAQAVASRTFTMKSALRSSKHNDSDVCTDPECCQAFVYSQDYTGSSDDLEKVMTAVKDTAGQVIAFQGSLIEATYFSSSGGRTEDAVAVWGTEVPYLQTVASPGEEISSSYEVTTQISHSDFLNKLGFMDEERLYDGDIKITYTDGGGVDTLTVRDRIYSGTQVRALLGLKSTNLKIVLMDNEIQIITKGYGHRVGMSQYGAEAMAIRGCTYDEILKHYYTGVDVLTLTQDEIKAMFDKIENF